MIVRPLRFELGGASTSDRRERQGCKAAKNSIAQPKIAPAPHPSQFDPQRFALVKMKRIAIARRLDEAQVLEP
jgi:hypothetical protein